MRAKAQEEARLSWFPGEGSPITEELNQIKISQELNQIKAELDEVKAELERLKAELERLRRIAESP
jgi:ubiquinone biosynthesis protein UbiJ